MLLELNQCLNLEHDYHAKRMNFITITITVHSATKMIVPQDLSFSTFVWTNCPD